MPDTPTTEPKPEAPPAPAAPKPVPKPSPFDPNWPDSRPLPQPKGASHQSA